MFSAAATTVTPPRHQAPSLSRRDGEPDWTSRAASRMIRVACVRTFRPGPSRFSSPTSRGPRSSCTSWGTVDTPGACSAPASHSRGVRPPPRRGGRHAGRRVLLRLRGCTRSPAAAAELTEALSSGPVQVRIGLHTGTPLVSDEGYVGVDVHRAARIAASGHGGQVLVSESTASLVDGDLRDLGEHRFKDLLAAERVYQLGSHEFPPISSLRRTNLPIAAWPLVGRERELAEIRSLVARREAPRDAHGARRLGEDTARVASCRGALRGVP